MGDELTVGAGHSTQLPKVKPNSQNSDFVNSLYARDKKVYQSKWIKTDYGFKAIYRNSKGEIVQVKEMHNRGDVLDGTFRSHVIRKDAFGNQIKSCDFGDSGQACYYDERNMPITEEEYNKIDIKM